MTIPRDLDTTLRQKAWNNGRLAAKVGLVRRCSHDAATLRASWLDGYDSWTDDQPQVQVLNDPALRLEYEEDNRDLTETWLRIKGSDKLLVVDPVELFRSALLNAGMTATEAGQILDEAALRIDQINGEDQ